MVDLRSIKITYFGKFGFQNVLKSIGFVGLTLCTHFRSKIRSKKWFFRKHEVNKNLLREKKFLLKFRFFVEKSKTVVMRRAQIKTNN